MTWRMCVTVAFLLIGSTPSSSGAFAEDKAQPTIEKHENHIDFKIGEHRVARYHVGKSVAKPYFYPVNAPNGTAITRGWPMTEAEPGERKDHVHQKSAWFCHGDVIPEGIEIKDKVRNVKGVDFWSEAKNHGKMVVTEVGKPMREGNHAWIETHNEWRTASDEKILDEKRVLHLYNLDGNHLLVLESDLHASVAPITFGDTKEGSMGVRVRHMMIEKEGGKLENSKGRVGAPLTWGQQADWCDYSGHIPAADGKGKVEAGITIFDDSGNKPRAAWHARDYGLMAANPFGRKSFPSTRGGEEFRLAKGEHLNLRYGLYMHMGDAKKGEVARAYEKFMKLQPQGK